jgi:hypothetical protein
MNEWMALFNRDEMVATMMGAADWTNCVSVKKNNYSKADNR